MTAPDAAPPPGPTLAPSLLSRPELRLAAAFWVVAGTTALFCGTFDHWLPYAAPLLAIAAAWPILRRRPWAGGVIDWLPFPLVLVGYEMLHAVSPRSWEWTIDPWLRAADRAILGGDAATYLDPFVSKPLTVTMAVCYVAYYVGPLTVAIWWARRGNRRAFRELMIAETGALFIGHLGYLFLPAMGPHVFFEPAAFHVPLVGDFVGPMIRARVHIHGNHARDAFPSLHTANAVTLLLTTWRHSRPAFAVWLLPMLGLILATVYLRFHYVVDVFAGIALAVLWQRAAAALAAREVDPKSPGA
ncbi:MAG: phosphatase PAP2 family protein [Planctomycetes bacterium]|nr:phosphatase PAP2 family protein [Planctomycetota bacterium]